jgi:tRNA(fMet)-specific endonuclease VapC
MRYLLDTNVISDMIRHPRGIVAQRVRDVGAESLCTSIVVAAELRYGAAKKGSTQLTKRVEEVLGLLDVIAFEAPMDATYALLRTALEKQGRPIGGNDLIIAAQALALGYAVVTDNEREFSGIEGLACENWLHDKRD